MALDRFFRRRRPQPQGGAELPDLWTQCPQCKEGVYNRDLELSAHVCPRCGHHLRLDAARPQQGHRLGGGIRGDSRAQRGRCRVTILWLFLAIAALLLLRVPVAFAFLGPSLAYMWLAGQSIGASLRLLTAAVSSFPLLAVPLFILLGVIAFDDAGLAATLFYLAAYGFSTLGAFATIAVVREPDRERGRDHGGLARARGRLDDGRPARVQRRSEVGQGGGERQAGAEAAEGGGEGGGDGDGIDGGGHRDPLCPPPSRCPWAAPLTRL